MSVFAYLHVLSCEWSQMLTECPGIIFQDESLHLRQWVAFGSAAEEETTQRVLREVGTGTATRSKKR